MAFSGLDYLLAGAIGLILLYVYQYMNGGASKKAGATKPAALSTKNGGSKDSGVTKHPMKIYFGSQSGTGENYAYDLAEEAKNFGFDAKVACLEEFEPSEFQEEKFVVFVAATHGEGEPTDDATQFWKWVCGSNKETEFTNTFSVFALGNKQYRYFCAVGKRIDDELAKMGGERLLECGLGDDDGHMEDDWEQWRNNFWTAARVKFMNLSEKDATSAGSSFNSSYELIVHPQQTEISQKYTKSLNKVARFFSNPGKDMAVDVVKMSVSTELRAKPTDRESTAHIDVDITGSTLSYRTADNLGIFPRNDFQAAGELAKRLGMQMSTVFTLKGAKSNRKAPVPSPCSVEDALLYYLDINNSLRAKFPAILASYASDVKEVAKLTYYANDTKGKEEFHNLRYNWLEVLEAFPSVQIPFGHFVELCARMQPRYYTIASSSKVQPDKISLTVSRLTGDKSNDRVFHGVCSGQLCDSISSVKNKEIIAYVRPSSFRLPVRAGTPIIMVGPGTGIAPFRGFIQEFYTRKENKYGDTVLYFGCRSSDNDYIYREELESARDNGVLTKLNVALSREQGQKKVYVQHLIEQDGEYIWELLNKGAYVFVCGATAMGNDVRKVMSELGQKYGGLTAAASEAFIDKLALQNRYVQELWSA